MDAFNVDHEVKMYCKTPIIKRKLKTLKWWMNHEDEFPTLASMARDWLAITASSVCSIAGNRLNPETAKGLLCMKSWWSYNPDLGEVKDDK